MPGVIDKIRAAMGLQRGQDWPEFESSLGTVAGELPEEVALMKSRQVRPYGVLDRLMQQPGEVATTTPWGNIAYDRAAIETAGLNPEDVMAHELTHVKQNVKKGPIRSIYDTIMGDPSIPYEQKPHEAEALGVERSRKGQRKMRRDIPLR